MFELLTVINLVVASFMVGNDYDSIVAYQERDLQADTYVSEQVVDDEDVIGDLDS